MKPNGALPRVLERLFDLGDCISFRSFFFRCCVAWNNLAQRCRNNLPRKVKEMTVRFKSGVTQVLGTGFSELGRGNPKPGLERATKMRGVFEPTLHRNLDDLPVASF